MYIAERVFRVNLGYINTSGTGNLNVTNSKQVVKNYISTPGKNYGLLILAHGNNIPCFSMDRSQGDAQKIYTSDISGVWHFVFINACSVMETDKMAQAFQTVGYTKRVALGWSASVDGPALKYWWGCYEKYAGKYGVSEAAVKAANDCIPTPYSTPIRAYGDKVNWNGKAW